MPDCEEKYSPQHNGTTNDEEIEDIHARRLKSVRSGAMERTPTRQTNSPRASNVGYQFPR